MHHTEKNTAHILSLLLKNMPDAMAYLKGSAVYPSVNGTVSFYQTDRGVFVITSMHGLPQGTGSCSHGRGTALTFRGKRGTVPPIKSNEREEYSPKLRRRERAVGASPGGGGGEGALELRRGNVPPVPAVTG